MGHQKKQSQSKVQLSRQETLFVCGILAVAAVAMLVSLSQAPSNFPLALVALGVAVIALVFAARIVLSAEKKGK